MRLKKFIAISVLSVIGIALLVILSSPIWMGWMIKNSQKETYEAISKVKLSCTNSTSKKIQAWGKAGYSVSCRKGEIINGPWQAWESGYLHIKGSYSNGEESGTWFIYTKDGSLYRTIEYKNGKEISDVIH